MTSARDEGAVVRNVQSGVAMKLSRIRRVGLGFAALLFMPVACALEGDQPPENDPPPASEGPENGSGGDPGSGSGPSSSGAGAGETAPECPYQGAPPLDPSTLPPCPTCTAGGAHCLPSSLVPPEFAAQLDACDADSTCVPDFFIETTGLFIPPTCSSVAGAEGRCLNKCIPEVAAKADLLPTDVCAEHEACVPCYDPQTGDPTGSCNLSCDPGPTEPPATLPSCCDGNGTCVPEAAAGENADKLGEDTCPQEGGALLCAPNVFVNDPNWSPPSCTTGTIQSLFGEEYAEGACLPECLPDVDNFLIGQDDCADGFKCAPCLQPPFGQSSGACDL